MQEKAPRSQVLSIVFDFLKRCEMTYLSQIKIGMTHDICVGYFENRLTVVRMFVWIVFLKVNGAPGAIRTPDRWYRKPVLYPAELRAHTSYPLRRLKL